MQPIVQRLQEYMNYRKLTGSRLSDALGYPNPEKIYRLFRKDSAKPSADILEDISNKFDDLDIRWLMTGKGKMLKLASKNVNNPPLTQEKGARLDENVPIDPSTQGAFVRESVRNPSGKGSKGGPKSVKNEMSDCPKCEEKERVIKALEGQIEVLKDALKGKQILVDEKERMIQKLERENTRQTHDSGKQHRRAG